MLEVGVDLNTLLIKLGFGYERLHRRRDLVDHIVPNTLLILEFGDLWPKSQHIDDSHRAVRLHENRRPIGPMAIQ